MATAIHLFFRLWMTEEIRSNVVDQLDDAALRSLRLTSSECRSHVTPYIFERIQLNFSPGSLSKPSRLEALSRIGHHVKHLTFFMPHTASTFLPPLLNPVTGREVTFLYTPHTSLTSEQHRPQYGNQELGNILTEQYPPIFHAATNVPAFIRFISHLPGLRHLSISTPGQEPTQRYRRSAVDYALISLRIALEHGSPPQLCKLTLSVHPSALLYLKSTPSIGSSPRSTKFTSQIRKLKITLDAWDFYSERPGHDHLKLLDTYVRSFASSLERVCFRWNGERGPCPFTLPADPLLAPPRRMAKLFAEITSPMSPLPAAPPRSAMFFPKLRHLRVRNVLMAAPQVSDLLYAHRRSVREFDFEDVELSDGGKWEDALAPLTKNIDGGGSGGDRWRSQQSFNDSGYESNQSLRSMPSNLEDDRDAWPCLGEDDILDTMVSEPKSETMESETAKVTTTTKLKKRRVKHRRRRQDNHDNTHVTGLSPMNKASASRELFGALPMAISPAVSRPLFGAISDISSPMGTLWPTVSTALMNSPLFSHPLTAGPNASTATLRPVAIGSTFGPPLPPVLPSKRQSHHPTLSRLSHASTASLDVPLSPLITLPATTFNANTPASLPSVHASPASPDMHPPPLNVLRDHKLDAEMIELAEDTEKRQSALRQAREAVLAKLGSQLSKAGHVHTTESTAARYGAGAVTGLRGLFGRRSGGDSSLGKGNGNTVAKHKQVGGSGGGGVATYMRAGNTRLDSATQLVPLMIFR